MFFVQLYLYQYLYFTIASIGSQYQCFLSQNQLKLFLDTFVQTLFFLHDENNEFSG